jgi:SAM-dependent methyltransferase
MASKTTDFATPYGRRKWIAVFHRYAYWKRWMRRRGEPGLTALELGSGFGYFADQAPTLIASDISLETCVAIAKRGHRRTVRVDALNIPFRDQTLGFIFAFDVLEHLQDPEAALNDAHRVLKPGGYFIAAVPNLEGLGARVKGDGWIAAQDPTHVSILHPCHWQELFRDSGFEIERLGADFTWDTPYPTSHFPALLQKAVVVVMHSFVNFFFGSLPWTAGENLIIVAKKV